MGPAVIKSPWVIEPCLAATVTIVDEITDIFSVTDWFFLAKKDIHVFKGTVYPKKYVSFTHPYVIPNLHEFPSLVLTHKKRYGGGVSFSFKVWKQHEGE